jgi:hypothetical protein
VNGAWHDDVIMGLLEHEFLSHNSCRPSEKSSTVLPKSSAGNLD